MVAEPVELWPKSSKFGSEQPVGGFPCLSPAPESLKLEAGDKKP